MYIKSLTGLRFIAVVFVLLSHSLFLPVVSFFALGSIGVDVFFTLSGFLITGILLKEKQKITNGYPLKKSLIFFYIRRSLRILPLFYSVIITSWIVKYPIAQECYLWLLTFTNNLQIAYDPKHLHFGGFGPFWSLSVEEQFYFFFPFFILNSLSLKWISRVLIFMIILSPLFRIYLFYTASNPLYAVRFSTIACIDSLSAGSLLALYQYNNFSSRVVNLFKSSFFKVVVVVFFLFAISYFKNNFIGLVFGRSATTLVTALLIFYCVRDQLAPWINRFLLLTPVQYIGKISYGIYVFHLFIIGAVEKYGAKIFPSGFPLVLLALAGSIAAGALSWELIEKRILKLKEHFIT
jgi:peptidoglycan/LPS O-acetylase OafA/YrhL